MSVITQKQVLELAANQTFRDVSKQFVRDRSTYLRGQVGTAGNLAGLTPENWARQRSIAAGVVFHPDAQDYTEWSTQFSMLLKGQDVWDTDAATTIDAMIASGKFDELAELTFATRATQIAF